MAITTEELRAVSLLHSVDGKELKKLASSLHERSYPAGKTVVEEGRGGIGFFLVLEGTAVVSVKGEERARLGPGATFGELAMIDPGADRSATVTAETALRCAGMTAWEFKPFVLGHPEVAWTLLGTLVARLREAEQRAAAPVAAS